MLELYQQISLNRDFLEYNLRKGDITTLMDIVSHPNGNRASKNPTMGSNNR